MRNAIVVSACMLMWSCATHSVQEPAVQEPATISTARFAVTHVTVAPMTCDCTQTDQTVVVEDGRIVWVGPSDRARLSPAIERIDGRGLYLMPGLYDVHVHQRDLREFTFYLANGVTTIVNLHGDETVLARRALLSSGEIIGPRLLTCGPPVRGGENDGVSGAAMVQAIAAAGYDCVKVRGDWSESNYLSVAAAATDAHILFMGHAPRNLPFSVVLNAGVQRIVHLEEIVYTTAELKAWVDASRGDPEIRVRDPRPELTAVITTIADELVRRGMWVVPTEIVAENFLRRATPQGQEWLRHRTYLRYHDPLQRRAWARTRLPASAASRWNSQGELHRLMLRIFRERGVNIAAGTDSELASDLNVMPGWALHEELRVYQQAGFTPYQALATATISAARYMGHEGEGIIAQGARADLLLLRENPMQDVANAERPLAVAVNGRWIDGSVLTAELARIERADAELESELAQIDTVIAIGGPTDWIAAWRTNPSPRVASYVEREVNAVGYRLLQEGHIEEAVEAFELNTDAFPNSANAFDSLGEALLQKGDRVGAIAAYQRAVQIDPSFTSSVQALRRLLAN